MGSSAHCDESASESIGCKSCVYSSDWEESCAENVQCPSGIANLEDLEISNICEEDLNHSMAQELGISLCGILHLHDTIDPLCVNNPFTSLDDVCNQKEMRPLSFDTNVIEGLSQCARGLCSETVQAYPSASDATKRLTSTTENNVNFSKDEIRALPHTLPATSKLISALKGSRAQQGHSMNTKLSVKWAAEVYDPPATLTSHTVKGHHHHHHHHHHHRYRHKASKDRHKHIKGKSSRGIIGERKHSDHRSSGSTADPRFLRLRTLNNSGLPKVEALDFVGTCPESKCGSSFYMDSLAPLQLSVAEAS